MKNLIFALALILGSYASFAQGDSIRIKNNTSCTIYFSLSVSTSASPCGFPGSSTNIVSIAPGATIQYNGTSWPGWTSSSPFSVFLMGKFYDTNPSLMCGSPAALVGEPCSGFPPALPTRWFYTNCSLCSNGQVIWTPPVTPNGLIKVELF